MDLVIKVVSRRTLLSMGNDTNAVYEYDIANRLKKLTNKFNSTQSQVFEYSDYDKVGNRKNMIVDTNEYTYEYDKLYQLIFVDYPAGLGYDASYYYDNLANRTSVVANGSTTYYLCNRLNQYTMVGSSSYAYDLNGNMTQYGGWRYYYDSENRLTDVNISSLPRLHYDYDYAGRRVTKRLVWNGTATKFVYDGDQIIADYNESGVLQRKYVYGPGIDEPVCMITVSSHGETKYYYHQDGLGSVVALTDNTGTIVEKYAYYAFGDTIILNANNEEIGASNYSNHFMFTGREYDYDSQFGLGLYYYRGRFYSPEIGRFMQTDPIGYYDSMNLYQYCGNNPVNFVDPWGEWTEEAHQSLGRYGGGGPNSKFDYARLDRDHSALNRNDRPRHFRQFTDAVKDALDAARRGNVRDFEYHVHEVQDYYSHTAVGYGPRRGHWYNPYAPDDPTRPENRERYREADLTTRSLENYWDLKNPPNKKS